LFGIDLIVPKVVPVIADLLLLHELHDDVGEQLFAFVILLHLLLGLGLLLL
jgi:hypothetical protein